jgi:hypothetical protein
VSVTTVRWTNAASWDIGGSGLVDRQIVNGDPSVA